MSEPILINEWRGDAEGTMHTATITILLAVVGGNYAVRVNEQDSYSYRAVNGDSIQTIASQLGTLLASSNWGTTVSGNAITLTGTTP
ncbi:MAG TPA: hypothetical protein VNQ76_02865, partial [Planctomicrobium sp.]|nr:hypothetical protein [Planctomicrobium sp.]